MKVFVRVLVILTCCLVHPSCEQNLNAPEVSDQQFTVIENAPAGTLIGVVDAYDLDEGQGFTYQIIEGNEGETFGIDQTGGFISVANPTLLDYEIYTEFILTVVVSDDAKDPKESTAAMTVSVKDLNEFAPVVEDQTFEVEEDPAKGAVIGTVYATDREVHQPLLYTILSGNEEEVFALDDDTGVLTVHDPSAFNLTNPQWVITVQVRDIHLDSKTDTAKITVNVIPK